MPVLYEPADIMIHIQGKGIVVKEKSVVAYQKSDNKIVAFGTEAYDMAGKNTEDIVVVSPLRQGMVIDYVAAWKLFSYLLQKAMGKKRPFLRRLAVAVCMPKGITPVEQKALEDVLTMAGAKEMFFSETSVEEFLEEFSEKYPKESQKCKITIAIAKDEPERYIKESIREVLEYAAQEQIPQQRVYELFEGLKEKKA